MIVVCLANTRSGTTALAQCFRANPTFVNLGEIFYAAPDGRGHYMEEWEVAGAPDIARFNAYLDFLREDRQRVYWLDVKFHDLRRFDPRQFAWTDPPLLLIRLVAEGLPTLLLDRANALRSACSELQAVATGKFHEAGDATGSDGRPHMKLDRGLTIGAIRGALDRRLAFRSVERLLLDHPNTFRLDYEAVFEAPEVYRNRQVLARWMGLELVDDPDLVKLADDWPSWFDQDLAREILRDTSADWWLA